MIRSVEFFNSEVDRKLASSNEDFQPNLDPTRFKWDRVNFKDLEKGKKLDFDEGKVRTGLYRPFYKQFVYFDTEQRLNNCTYQMRRFFPTIGHSNIGFSVCSASNRTPFSLLATSMIPNLGLFMDPAQFFPRFKWDPVKTTEGELFAAGNASVGNGENSMYGQVGEVVDGYVRVDNVTDEIRKLYRDAFGEDISGDDIFHFVYGKLHDPEYRTKYSADLKKMLPHIEKPDTRKEFDRFVLAGKQLIDLHVHYEDLEPWPLDVQVKGDPEDRETWRVIKPKWKKKKDPETGKNVADTTTMVYNRQVTITNIPEEAEEYQLGSRSALDWIIDRYQVSVDKRGKSGIVNDPNDWADEVGNPRYIVDLVGKVTRVAMETNRIVRGLEG